MIISPSGTGSISGLITLVSIEDAKASLSYQVQLPLTLRQEAATLSVKVLYPEASSWAALSQRQFIFDESTEVLGRSDGMTYKVDQVRSIIRKEEGWYDTEIRAVRFGDIHEGATLEVEIEGLVRTEDNTEPFQVKGHLRPAEIKLEEPYLDDLPRLVDYDYYHPKEKSGKFYVLQPK